MLVGLAFVILTLIDRRLTDRRLTERCHYAMLSHHAVAAAGKNVFQHSYRGSVIDAVIAGFEVGRAGLESNFIPACVGVRPPFRELQTKQQHTTFSQVVGPSCDLGTT